MGRTHLNSVTIADFFHRNFAQLLPDIGLEAAGLIENGMVLTNLLDHPHSFRLTINIHYQIVKESKNKLFIRFLTKTNLLNHQLNMFIHRGTIAGVTVHQTIDQLRLVENLKTIV